MASERKRDLQKEKVCVCVRVSVFEREFWGVCSVGVWADTAFLLCFWQQREKMSENRENTLKNDTRCRVGGSAKRRENDSAYREGRKKGRGESRRVYIPLIC